MYASQFISDAAVFPPQPPRRGFGPRPGDDEPAEERKAGLIETLRGFVAAHASALHSSSRAH